MIEIKIKEFLSKQMTVPILLEHQRDEPDRFVIFERISNSDVNKINGVTFAFQSYAESMYEAAKLNEDLKKAVFALLEWGDIGKVKLETDYNFTDTETKKYRYQAIFNISY